MSASKRGAQSRRNWIGARLEWTMGPSSDVGIEGGWGDVTLLPPATTSFAVHTVFFS